MFSRTTLIAALAAAFALAGCGGTSVSTPTPSGPTVYKQTELLARPAVKEVFEPFADHDATNRGVPYNDTTLANDIVAFTDAFRSPANGTTLQSILIPNEIAVDLSQTGPSAYLGVETGGATGGKFGGRGPQDDVIDISLGAIFGNTLSALGLIPDDGKENACLTKQNVTQSPTQYSSTFPYLGAPH